jgi:hypothetical protein
MPRRFEAGRGIAERAGLKHGATLPAGRGCAQARRRPRGYASSERPTISFMISFEPA